MRLAQWLSGFILKHLSPRQIMVMTMEVFPQYWGRIPQHMQVSFLQTFVIQNLGTVLANMERNERAALLNGILPMVAKEFPLYDLDLLTAFPTNDVEPDQAEIRTSEKSTFIGE